MSEEVITIEALALSIEGAHVLKFVLPNSIFGRYSSATLRHKDGEHYKVQLNVFCAYSLLNVPKVLEPDFPLGKTQNITIQLPKFGDGCLPPNVASELVRNNVAINSLTKQELRHLMSLLLESQTLEIHNQRLEAFIRSRAVG